MSAKLKRVLVHAAPLPDKLVNSETLRIDLDKALQLAPKPRPLKQKWELTSTADSVLVDLVTDLIREQLQLQRFNRSKHRAVVSMVLANVIYAAKHSAQVLYSRRKETDKSKANPEGFDNRIIIRVIDCLESLGLVHNRIGASNEHQHVRSWCEATQKLSNIVNELRLNFGLSSKAPAILLRDAQKRDLAISKQRAIQLKAKALETPVRAFNRFWHQHRASISIPTTAIQNAPVVPYLHRVFNLSLDLGGRFYGDYQTFSKYERSCIRIDDSETIELDYSALHMNLLYSQENIQFFGDANSIEGLNRPLAKALILRLLNSDCLSQFKANVTRSAQPEIKRAWLEWQEIKQRPLFLERHTAENRKPNYLEGFIEGVPEGLTGEHALELISKRHAPIAHHFGSENIGLRLQYLDSQIMAQCLTNCLTKQLPVLPVHDSLICKKADSSQVKQIMKKAYSDHANNFKIAIK